MSNGNAWLELLSRHWGKILGCALGFIIGLIIIKYGFLQGGFLLAMAALGLYIGGRQVDGNEDLRDYLGDFWPPRRSR